jgi:xanthosine phosphorylase
MMGNRSDAIPAQTALDVIRAAAPGFRPRVGLVLGSGLGGLTREIKDAVVLPYAGLPDFPLPSVEGHAGQLVLGRLAGLPIACLQGRAHLFEGMPAAAINIPVRTLKGLGCDLLILTSAAGSLRIEVGGGEIVLITDHINLSGQSPLVGPNDAAIGPRSPDLSAVYDRPSGDQLTRIAKDLGIPLHRGVYASVLGPNFETPAEIRAFRSLGADLVGMSMAPEAISAHHAGLKVIGLAVVVNPAAGLGDAAISREQNLVQATGAAARLTTLVKAFCAELAQR